MCECGKTGFSARISGPHLQVVCEGCGKHIAFVKQPGNVDNGDPASEKQDKFAKSLMRKAMQVDRITARQAGAVISAFSVKQ